MDNKNNEKEPEFTLALQKWDTYILKQHQKGDQLQDLEETLYFSKKNFIRYFSTISALINRNSSYISKFKEMEETLKKLKLKIISNEFLQEVAKDTIKMKDLNVDFVTPKQEYINMVDEVKNIFKQIQIDFTKRKINPESIEIKLEQEKGGKKLEH